MSNDTKIEVDMKQIGLKQELFKKQVENMDLGVDVNQLQFEKV